VAGVRHLRWPAQLGTSVIGLIYDLSIETWVSAPVGRAESLSPEQLADSTTGSAGPYHAAVGYRTARFVSPPRRPADPGSHPSLNRRRKEIHRALGFADLAVPDPGDDLLAAASAARPSSRKRAPRHLAAAASAVWWTDLRGSKAWSVAPSMKHGPMRMPAGCGTWRGLRESA
jgi:hypothetical protein